MPPVKKEANFKLAINLYDLDRLDPHIRVKLLVGRIDLLKPIKVAKDRVEPEPAVVFNCGLLTAASICDIIRNEDRNNGDFPTRLYIYRQDWSRIPSHIQLTIVVGGKIVLNPEFFKVTINNDLMPLPTKIVTF